MCPLDYDSISWDILMLIICCLVRVVQKQTNKPTPNQNKITISKLFYLIFPLNPHGSGITLADSLGLQRYTGQNCPVCRLQALGLCMAFSGVTQHCRFSFHLLEANRRSRNRTQLYPDRDQSSSSHPAFLAVLTHVGRVCKHHLQTAH